jgi:Tfp pilus assembly protein PilF
VLQLAAKLAPKDPQIAAEQCEMYVDQAQFEELRGLLKTWDGRLMEQEQATDVWLVALSRILEDSLVVGLYSSEVTTIIDLAQTTLPSAWPVMIVAGTVSMAVQDTARAATCFTTVTSTAQVIPEGYLEIGRVYAMKDMPKRALEFLSIGRVVFPTDIRFPIIISSLYMDQGNDRQAINELEAATILDSTVADVWVQLGMLYDRSKRLLESDQAYERALALEPANALANNNYAYSLSLRRIELDRAKNMAFTAVNADKANAAFLDTYAWILYQQEDYEGARTYILKAIQYGGNATHYEHYGMILKAIGERNASIKAFERSLELDPSRSWVRDELEALTK